MTLLIEPEFTQVHTPARPACHARTGTWWYVLLVIAIVHQIGPQYYLGKYFHYDQFHQIGAAQSLWDGAGITLPKFNPDDWGTPQRRPMIGWPPGYLLLFGLVNRVIGNLQLTAWL